MSGGNDGVIKIKGDNTHLDKTTEKSVENMKQLGRHASAAHGHAKTFGQAWEHANQHMARTAIHAISIGGALHTAVHLLEEFQNQAEEASKKVGEIGLQTASIAGRLGLQPDKLEAYTGGASPIARKDRLAFAGHLADKETVGRSRRKVTETEYARSQALFNSGLFDQKEIEYALDHGTLDALAAEKGKREEDLQPKHREELETRRQENAKAEAAEDTRAEGGQALRRQQASFDEAVAGTAFDIPGVKQVLGASYKFQGNGLTTEEKSARQKLSMWSSEPEGGWEAFREGLREQTEQLKPPPTTVGPAR
jgi:hypothetical protein